MTSQESTTSDPLPEARILPTSKRPYSAASIAALIPILAILFSAWYLVRAWDQRGLEITIHFEDGHGIKAGDGLRYHGITVGEVEDVSLAPSLEGVDVRVQLIESSRALARTGSRYWIVRPQVEFAGISGLDTVLGAHYLNVIPGPDDGATRQAFEGLDGPPIDIAPGSLELVLEAAERGSARRGSPVTWRRTPVGQVLSTELSSDARVVEVRIAIEPEFTSLVLENSRFFEVGGLTVDVGIGGMHMEIESLQSLITGGVAFATPDNGGAPATSEAHFSLHSKPEEEWLKWRPALAVGKAAQSSDAALLPTRAILSWEEGIFSRDKDRKAWVLWLSSGLLGPADMLHSPEDSDDGAKLKVSGKTYELSAEATKDELVTLFAVDSPPAAAAAAWPRSRLRRPSSPEDCLATGDPTLAPLALAANHLSEGDLPWTIGESLPVDTKWHGAAVTSRETGDLIGILLVDEDGAKVAGIPTALLP